MPLGHGEVTSRSPCRTAWDRYSARRTVQAVQSCSVLKPRLQRGFFLRGPDWNPTLEGVPLRSRPSGPLCDAAGARDHWTLAAITGLVPIPVMWLLVYIVAWTVRWIRRGFQLST